MCGINEVNTIMKRSSNIHRINHTGYMVPDVNAYCLLYLQSKPRAFFSLLKNEKQISPFPPVTVGKNSYSRTVIKAFQYRNYSTIL